MNAQVKAIAYKPMIVNPCADQDIFLKKQKATFYMVLGGSDTSYVVVDVPYFNLNVKYEPLERDTNYGDFFEYEVTDIIVNRNAKLFNEYNEFECFVRVDDAAINDIKMCIEQYAEQIVYTGE